MKNYRIALLAEEINQSYQREIINGISTSAPEFNLDVFAFTSFSGSLNNPKHDAGELNIFNLPDFRRFDGAILLTNTLTNKEVLGNILERIKTAGIPAVSIDNDVPFLYHIGIDNKTAMREITEHMIKKHGCRRLNYISGPKENPESADRLAAFLSVLKENDINIEDEQILNYLLAFVQSFSDNYIPTSLPKSGAGTEQSVSVFLHLQYFSLNFCTSVKFFNL